jgi:hypothetical protein
MGGFADTGDDVYSITSRRKGAVGFDLIRIAHAISSGRFELPCLP